MTWFWRKMTQCFSILLNNRSLKSYQMDAISVHEEIKQEISANDRSVQDKTTQ